jgi:hypothetical protein
MPASIPGRHRATGLFANCSEPDLLLVRRPNAKENAILTTLGAEAETLSPHKAGSLVLGSFTWDGHAASMPRRLDCSRQADCARWSDSGHVATRRTPRHSLVPRISLRPVQRDRRDALP